MHVIKGDVHQFQSLVTGLEVVYCIYKKAYCGSRESLTKSPQVM